MWLPDSVMYVKPAITFMPGDRLYLKTMTGYFPYTADPMPVNGMIASIVISAREILKFSAV